MFPLPTQYRTDICTHAPDNHRETESGFVCVELVNLSLFCLKNYKALKKPVIIILLSSEI